MAHLWNCIVRQSYFIPQPAMTEKNCPDVSGRVFFVTGGTVCSVVSSMSMPVVNKLSRPASVSNFARFYTNTMERSILPVAHNRMRTLLLQRFASPIPIVKVELRACNWI